MIATTTTISVNVKPDCKARLALDLAIDFTIRVPSPSQLLTQSILFASFLIYALLNTWRVWQL
jgi:hypothetical protein